MKTQFAKTIGAFVLVLLMSLPGWAESAFKIEAFSNRDVLYVLVLGDSCNKIVGALVVNPSCHHDRLTRNAALICEAELKLVPTEIACQDPRLIPQMVEIDLSEENVAIEARLLNLTYQGQKIEVPLNRLP